MQTLFLSRNEYWKEIEQRLPAAQKVVAAIAYFASDGAALLPLRPGDEIVVDMSYGAVKQGVTDPREIAKLIQRGVKVFTRSSLHAKAIVIDDVVISTSANVSKNARHCLDECAILTNSRSSVVAATRYIRSLCSEPVRDRYLSECIALYRPPVFKAARTVSVKRQKGISAKLWYIAGLVPIDADKDRKYIAPLELAAEAELSDPEHTEVSWIRMAKRTKWYSNIKRNNWVIDCMRVGKRNRQVGIPARVIRKRKYTNRSGKTYHMLMLERAIDGESMSLSAFQTRWRAEFKGHRAPTRSVPIQDEDLADRVLRFWTMTGKVSRRKMS